MSNFISVKDRYPDKAGVYRVRIDVGSISVENYESLVNIRDIDIKRKNLVFGDWTRLTHWEPLSDD